MDARTRVEDLRFECRDLESAFINLRGRVPPSEMPAGPTLQEMESSLEAAVTAFRARVGLPAPCDCAPSQEHVARIIELENKLEDTERKLQEVEDGAKRTKEQRDTAIVEADIAKQGVERLKLQMETLEIAIKGGGVVTLPSQDAGEWKAKYDAEALLTQRLTIERDTARMQMDNTSAVLESLRAENRALKGETTHSVSEPSLASTIPVLPPPVPSTTQAAVFPTSTFDTTFTPPPMLDASLPSSIPSLPDLGPPAAALGPPATAAPLLPDLGPPSAAPTMHSTAAAAAATTPIGGSTPPPVAHVPESTDQSSVMPTYSGIPSL